MNKRIYAVLISVILGFCTLSFVSCKKTTIEIIEPPDGYTVTPGGMVEIEVKPSEIGVIKFTVDEGEEFVEGLTDGGRLTVGDGGKEFVGKTIKITVTLTIEGKTVRDNTTVKIVDIKLSGITNLHADLEEYMFPGETSGISYDLVPANTTQDDVEVQIISGPASFTDGKIKVPASATEGEIKLKVFRGEISNTLTIPVILPSDDPHYLSGADVVVVENRGVGSKASFTLRVNDESGDAVEGAQVTFSVSKGSQFLSIEPNGYTCFLNLLGHGTAEVTATLRNGKRHPVTVNCIKTPSRLDIPEYMSGKNNIEYTVAKEQAFDYAAVVPSLNNDSGACKDVEYTFESLEENATGEPATYQGGKITFNSVGKIKVIATSKSGNSNGEVSVSRTFTVNEGVNVSTWEELKEALEKAENAGKDINIVATKKIDDDYNLIPRVILDKVMDAESHKTKLTAHCQFSVSLNGNGHGIDFEKLVYNSACSDAKLGDALLFRSASDGADPGFDVKIKDLNMYGNVDIDGRNIAVTDKDVFFPQPTEDGEINGTHDMAINIGNTDKKSYYNVSIDNVKIYNFNVGIGVNRTRPGSKCSNIEISECFKMGFNLGASILEINNATFGNFGAFAIEPYIGSSNDADDGNAGTTNQQVTITGNTKVFNLNAGNTKFFSGYKFMDNTLPMMIDGLLLHISDEITPSRLSHVRNSEGEYAFFMFIFTDPTIENDGGKNHTQIFGDAENEIAIATDIEGINTTAKFIEISLGNISLPLIGSFDLGKLIFFNLNYQAA